MSTIPHNLKDIRAVVFDIDGVLSTDVIPLHPNGDPMRSINIKDGYAIHLACKKNFIIGIISGAKTESVRIRYKALGVNYIYLAASDKKIELADFLLKTGLKAEQVAYMGDDIPDYEIMKMVGLAACPADASPEIRSIAQYISHKNGGEGCGRDLLEQVLKAHGIWMSDSDAFGW